jgi:uncharacterized protein involved in exopolysaccharide biosynthesis
MTNNTNTDPVVQPQEDGEEINLLDLLLVVVKHKRMIIRFTLAVAVLTAVYSLSLPNIYTSEALIFPSQEDKGLASAMLAQLGGLAGLAGGSLGGKTLEELYVTMLKSEAIKDPIIDRFGLMKRFKAIYRADAYRRLDANAKVSAGKKDGVITISVSDRDPRWAAAVADAYVRELGSLTVRLNVTGAGKNRLFLENRLGGAKSDLARAEDALKAFQTKNKALDVPEQAKATIGGVAQLRAQLALHEVQLATLRRQFTDASQEVKNAKASIDNMKAQINQLEGQGGGSIPSIGSVPDLGQEYIRLMREFKVQETIVELLTKQYELAKINETKDISPFQVIQSPKVPERKSKPKRSIMVILATLTAFFFSVLVAFIREYADKMPEEDKTRWREIIDLSGMKGVAAWAGSKWTALANRIRKRGIPS